MSVDQYSARLSIIFEEQLQKLMKRVKFLRTHNSDYLSHPDTKLLLGIDKVIKQSRINPNHPSYNLGKTLGAEFTNWRRCKKGGLYSFASGCFAANPQIALDNLNHFYC